MEMHPPMAFDVEAAPHGGGSAQLMDLGTEVLLHHLMVLEGWTRSEEATNLIGGDGLKKENGRGAWDQGITTVKRLLSTMSQRWIWGRRSTTGLLHAISAVHTERIW
jgi:hypothetical protein